MKRPQSLDELAIFGDEPAFAETLHVGRPNLAGLDRFRERLEDILERRWLTNNGPYVKQLEATVADWLEVEHCVAVSNATTGLELLVRALDLSGEVVLPAMTFVATAHAMTWMGLKPVFCDIDPATHNLDLDQLERCITPRTSAILAVHLWGRPCDPQPLQDLARESGVELLFDAAHALGCTSGGRWIGGFGRAEVFSLHATKFVNSFEGGLITTADARLARSLRLMRNFGFSGMDDVTSLGVNAKLNEVSAAMGLTQVEASDDIVATNRANYLAYQSALAESRGVKVIEYDLTEYCNYQYVVLEVDEHSAGLNRDLLMRVLHAENVKARRYFYPGVHRMQPYAAPGAETTSVPATDELVEKVLVLPTGQAVTPDTVEEICGLIEFCLAHGGEVASRARAGCSALGAA